MIAAAMMVLVISSPALGHAGPPDNPPLQREAFVSNEAKPGPGHSVTKALSYQAVVVTTDQILYWFIITGTAASELGFLTANAVTGVAYYVGFEEAWRATSLDPTEPDDVSFAKAITYRVFDTVRVLGITLAIGTPIAGSLAVTGAIAATRTGIYMLHEYAWSAWDSTRVGSATTNRE